MKRKLPLLVILFLLLLSAMTGHALANYHLGDELAAVRASTAKFHLPEKAQAAGWDLVPGLDYCFENPGVGAMGYHYLNTSLLDLTVDAEKPEAMVYPPSPNGDLRLGAVEYIVPASSWDAAGNSQPPSLFGIPFHLNANLGVYVLHAWVWENNPTGMFEDWNPRVSCDPD